MTSEDLARLIDLDGTVESTHYLHVERMGEGLGVSWRIEERPLRSRRIEPNAMDEQRQFVLKHVVAQIEEGLALVAEHQDLPVGMLLAQVDHEARALRVLDVRIDYDQRRQGLGSAMLYRAIQEARDRGLRAVSAHTRTDNVPAARFLLKAGFDVAGLDTHLASNHDLVKETVTLFWYAALD
jgi:ribosomal protein S18 acetylase RimI-like enzyme